LLAVERPFDDLLKDSTEFGIICGWTFERTRRRRRDGRPQGRAELNGTIWQQELALRLPEHEETVEGCKEVDNDVCVSVAWERNEEVALGGGGKTHVTGMEDDAAGPQNTQKEEEDITANILPLFGSDKLLCKAERDDVTLVVWPEEGWIEDWMQAGRRGRCPADGGW
jgi:hypothetical protein